MNKPQGIHGDFTYITLTIKFINYKKISRHGISTLRII